MLKSSQVPLPIISYSKGSSKNSFNSGLSNMTVFTMNFCLEKEGSSKEREGEIRRSPTPVTQAMV